MMSGEAMEEEALTVGLVQTPPWWPMVHCQACRRWWRVARQLTKILGRREVSGRGEGSQKSQSNTAGRFWRSISIGVDAAFFGAGAWTQSSALGRRWEMFIAPEMLLVGRP